MTEPDLRALLASPALDLEPPADLVEGVHRGARRVRWRRAAGTAALALVVLVGAASVVPRLQADKPTTGQVALPPDSRFPQSTTPIAVLERLNGGEVVTFFEGARWCTASSRADTSTTCSRNIGAVVQPFAFLSRQGTESLSVDADGLVAGLLGDGVATVEVELSDGRTIRARSEQPGGFARAVWWLRVPAGAVVVGYTARDDRGQPVARRS